MLTSEAVSYYAAKIELVSRQVEAEDSVVGHLALGLSITREINEGLHEDLEIRNYGGADARFQLAVLLRTDFADIFEVKRNTRVQRRGLTSNWRTGRHELIHEYRAGNFERRLTYRIRRSDSPPAYANGRVIFEVALPPKGRWRVCTLSRT